jgi:hypothetical protein
LLKTLAGILYTVVEKTKGNYVASFGATIKLLLRRTLVRLDFIWTSCLASFVILAFRQKIPSHKRNYMHKEEVAVGFLYHDGEKNILEVTWYIFSDLISYKLGKPIPMNEVHVNIYKETDKGILEKINEQTFLNIQYLYPLPVKENYLKFVGFNEDVIDNESVLRCGNIYFKKNGAFKGVNLAYEINSDNIYPVIGMHEAQQLVRSLNK